MHGYSYKYIYTTYKYYKSLYISYRYVVHNIALYDDSSFVYFFLIVTFIQHFELKCMNLYYNIPYASIL